MAKLAPLFIDTSTVIASEIHSPKVIKLVSQRLDQHLLVLISETVCREYKRRVLKEALYLIQKLEREKSYDEVFHAVNRLFGLHQRKKNICMGLFSKAFGGDTDSERAERSKMHLTNLLEFGLAVLKSKFEIIPTNSCALGQGNVSVATTKSGKIKCDFGPVKCSKSGNKCHVRTFLETRRAEILLINQKLKAASVLTQEQNEMLTFTTDFLKSKAFSASQNDPCDKVADLLIALESNSLKDFATLNYKESLLLCEVLKQRLYVLPSNPANQELIHDFT